MTQKAMVRWSGLRDSLTAACGLSILLVAIFLCGGCAGKKSVLADARVHERSGRIEASAKAYEAAASRSRGRTQAVAWYNAGRLWVDPENQRRGYPRALACFRKVDTEKVDEETRRNTLAWIDVLSRLVSAEAAAREAEAMKKALEDVSRVAP